MSYLGETTVIYVDSDSRENGTHSNFTYRINLPRDNKYNRVALLQASIPKSFYIIQSGRNSFELEEGKLIATITVPPGNYSANAFRLELETLLNTNSPNQWTYTVTLDQTKGKYTYAVTGNTSQPSISFWHIDTSLYKQMGFDYNSINPFVGNSLTSTNVLNFSVIPAIYIKSDVHVPTTNVLGDAILQEIFVANTSDYQNIGFQNTSPELSAKKFASNKEVFSFVITDADDQIIDLNGNSINFSLCFFEHNNEPEIMKKYIQLQNFEDMRKSLLNEISSVSM